MSGEAVFAPPPSPRGEIKGRRRWLRWVLGLALVPVLLVVALIVYGRFRVRIERALTTAQQEARVNVLTLCSSVAALQFEAGGIQATGPQPASIPRGEAVPWPHDAGFERLGFSPGPDTRFQYEVQLGESPVGEPEVACLARGDLDGDGVASVYRVTLDANGMTSPITVEHEGE